MKLITWNAQCCKGLDGVVSPERIVAEARSMADFDVLCLQEIAVNYTELTQGSAADQVARLRALLPEHEVHFGAAVQERGPDGAWRQFGNLIASRLPVLQVQHHPLPWPADTGEGESKEKGNGVRSMPRMCSVVTVQAPFGQDAGQSTGQNTRALRIMTTHLEYYSPRQRMAQALALRELHRAACEQALNPPFTDEHSEGPFRAKPHTTSALLCGDFNLPPSALEYSTLQLPFDSDPRIPALGDLWPAVHGGQAHDPTFLLYDRRWGPEPIACDFVFASADLLPRARRIEVNSLSQASDHQPVLVELDHPTMRTTR